MAKSKPDKDAKKSAEPKVDAKEHKPADGGWRETVESVAMAVILALLFRGFVAEAFVIPTGSMAPTLQGRHKDVECPQCGIWYQTSASVEAEESGPEGKHVISTTCPVCQFTQNLQLFDEPNDHSFSGDRIIVGKFCYDFAQPERWDVIVFKFPGNAVQNYIKRLIGLPGETIQIAGGNIYVGANEGELTIARKPPHKLNVLLQIVDDTNHIPQALIDIGWPARWQAWPADAANKAAWTSKDGGRTFAFSGEQAGDSWLRYRHHVPSYGDWLSILDNELPPGVADRPGQLIPDYYAYNTAHYIEEDKKGKPSWYLKPGRYNPQHYDPKSQGLGAPPPLEMLGQNWVDDLALEVEVDVTSDTGEVLMMLVRGGTKYLCRIDVATGQATLSIVDHTTGEPLDFDGPPGKPPVAHPVAETSVKGSGSYRLKLANCDHEMVLWVNGAVAKFNSPTSYPSPDFIAPYYSAADPGDLAPAGIGSNGAGLHVTRLKLFRDKYYIASDDAFPGRSELNDYKNDNDLRAEGTAILDIFANPQSWEASGLFGENDRRTAHFTLEENQFLPLGDNSPASYDGRYWLGPLGPHHYVERDLLIGKALLIYWPHTWNRPIPFLPDVRKMGPIR